MASGRSRRADAPAAGGPASPAEGGTAAAPVTARQVLCPTCRQPTLFGPSNPWRPFCSARCRGADLGAWATEDYRVPAVPPTEPDEGPAG